MPPQIIGYDPYRGINAIAETGQNISNILTEAKQAEMQRQQLMARQRGIDLLHKVITERSQTNPLVGTAPFLDPVVTAAAMDVAPVAGDYVQMLKGVHDTNVKLLEPKGLAGDRYTVFNPATGTFDVKEGATDANASNRFLSIFGIPGNMLGTDARLIALMHLNDPAVKDEQGRIIPDKLAKVIYGDLPALYGAKTAATSQASQTVGEKFDIKAEERKSLNSYNAAVTKFTKLYPNTAEGAAKLKEILSTDQQQGTGAYEKKKGRISGKESIGPKYEFSMLDSEGNRVLRPEVKDLLDSYAKLPQTARDSVNQSLGVTAPKQKVSIKALRDQYPDLTPDNAVVRKYYESLGFEVVD